MTRVLVIEDEESYRDAVSYVLVKEGFEVAVAATGPAGLAEFEAIVSEMEQIVASGAVQQLAPAARTTANA